ncbi:Lipopolysaccharide assembly protein A [Vibrio stylophorae]|uniref:Probable lipopolysaccharide assembly protein A n=1 Tax=Vibrio stylophorae TaxID=659351 RepID=A0ABM8ZS17_9VIBR|nr:lipopolysaccharide assembly protein LapA domain-containing protein [Vibrio stylophorae]CAH0533089.1 Lipopolysaccharide assembly protein A [Vibrio stylophorae]
MRIILTIAIVICLVIAVMLGAENHSEVTFNYLVAQDQFNLSTLLGGAFALGLLVGLALFGLKYLALLFTKRRLEKQFKKQQAELATLRDKAAATPLTDSKKASR